MAQTTPTFFIGLGGTGARVVTKVRRQVLHAMELAADKEAAKLVDSRFQFFAYDTWDDKQNTDLADLKALGTFEVTGDRALNSTVRQKLAGTQDPFFRKWWPDNYTNPGDLVNGAGKVRIKGKAACYLTLSSSAATSAATFGRKLEMAISKAADIHQHEEAFSRLPVFLVSGLSGGTGSGAFLLLANYLRQYLPQKAMLIGVFLLPGIMTRVVAEGAHTDVLANGQGALKELDFWMAEDDQQKKRMSPFIEFPNGQRFDGLQPPFEFCYLFGHENASGAQLASFDDYVGLVADCLSVEIYSPITQQAKGNASNFYQDVSQLGTYGEEFRSRQYGSASVSSLMYPVEQITDFLAMEYMQLLLDDSFLSPSNSRPTAKDAAEDFVRDHRLEDGEQRDLTRGLLGRTIQGVTPPAEPPLAQRLGDARREEVQTVIAQTIKQVEDIWLAKHAEIASINVYGSASLGSAGFASELSRDLDTALDDMFQRTDISGFEVAQVYLEELERVLETEISRLGERLNGKDEPGSVAYRPGLLARKKEMLATPDPRNPSQSARTLQGQVKIIVDEYGELLFRRKVEQKKKDFIERWFKPYLNVELEIMRVEKARAFLQEFRTKTVLRLLSDVNVMAGELIVIRDRFGSDAPNRLVGAANGASAITGRILSDPQMVRARFLRGEPIDTALAAAVLTDTARGIVKHLHAFWDLSRPAETAGVNGAARNVTDSSTSTEARDRAIAAANEEISQLLLGQGRRRFHQRVAALSLWDALGEEAKSRTDGKPDQVQKYIESKLHAAISRSFPFWLPDEVSLATLNQDLGRTIKAPMFAFNVEQLERFNGRMGTNISVEQMFGAEFGVGTPLPMPDPYRLLFYVRQGGLPLSALDHDELRKLRLGEESYVRTHGNTPLFTDLRYAAALPPTLIPDEGRSDLYAMMMALHFGILRFAPGHDGEALDRLQKRAKVGTAIRWVDLYGGVGIRQCYERLRGDLDTQHWLISKVDEAFRELETEPRQFDAVDAVLQMAFDRANELEQTDPGTELCRFWQMAWKTLDQHYNANAVLVAG